MKKYRSEADLERIHQLLTSFSLTEWPGSEDTFLLLGYKMVSLGAKETYQVLRNLAISTYKSDNKKGYTCQVSYDFLSIALGTTRLTQIRRIKELEKYELVKILKRYNMTNTYGIEPRPFPDETFEIALKKLIERRECLKIIYTAGSFDNLQKFPDQWEQLSEMYETPFCKELIVQRFSNFQPIKTT